ncbi:MAG: crotonase/enoyl-CoA hydratase family protein [Bacteroidia bacterium]
MDYQTLSLHVVDHIAEVRFNRPEKANALDEQAWKELLHLFQDLDTDSSVRVVILGGNGRHFCAGIDLTMLMSLGNKLQGSCEGRKREAIRQQVRWLQSCITAIEQCRKPVLAAVHGGCIGAGVDIITACDMRYASEDAYFSVKEIDMGLVADLGTLQRLPRIVPEGLAREMAYTGRKVPAAEARQIGLLNQTFGTTDALQAGVREIAASIAVKSPLVTRGIKEVMNYSRDHSIADALNYVATWNAGMILSDDLYAAFQAAMKKETPVFCD